MSRPVPDATSTPTSFPYIQGRKGIRDSNSVESPIDSGFPRHQYETRSQIKTSERTYESTSPPSPKKSPKGSPQPRSTAISGSESDQYSNGDDSPNSDDFPNSDVFPTGDDAPNGDHSRKNSRQPQKNGSIAIPLVLGILVLAIIAVQIGDFGRTEDSTSEPDIQEQFMSIEKEFPKQDLDFWRTIRVSIQEIPVLDQPRTIMFLYNNKAEKTLNKILNRVSDIGVCRLRKCSDKPVIIEGASLNTTEIINDYGKIISNYRNGLEKNGVMIIKNLEKVPGKSAQAFHSICDDYNPVVKHALILFTVKVEKIPQGYTGKFIEDFLLKLWNDIGRDDKFYPLFTRVTSTVLSVRP